MLQLRYVAYDVSRLPVTHAPACLAPR